MYTPQPLDTAGIELPSELLKYTEQIAEHVHEVWAKARIAEGWKQGPKRNDERKEHPCLVPYSELSESEKEYDRQTAMETLKAIGVLGLRIEK
jgi:ryanodine receptor 2